MMVLIYLRSEEHTSELQSRFDLVCRLLLEKKKYILLAGLIYVWSIIPVRRGLTCIISAPLPCRRAVIWSTVVICAHVALWFMIRLAWTCSAHRSTAPSELHRMSIIRLPASACSTTQPSTLAFLPPTASPDSTRAHKLRCASHTTSNSLFFFNNTAPTDIYTLSLHDALPI